MASKEEGGDRMSVVPDAARVQEVAEDVLTEVIAVTARELLRPFLAPSLDPGWSFADKTTRHTRYVTHGYHSYPAKFIPQLAERLIRELTRVGDWVLDPFMGSGTTLVEAKLLGRPSVGVDINPVAHLISLAKTTAVEPHLLDGRIQEMARTCEEKEFGQLSLWRGTVGFSVPKHDRMDYWFHPEIQGELAQILALVEATEEEGVRDVLRCAFSASLKTSSIWQQRSTKPTRDFKKRVPKPWDTFLNQARRTAKGNAAFHELLRERDFLDVPVMPHCGDARQVPVEDGKLSLVVTSPPYVTSYEYADLHQLTALWFQHMTDLPGFRKRFIGTSYHEEKPVRMDSQIGDEIVRQLDARKPKTGREVATYFTDMREVFLVLKKKLKPGGRACIVVGNTNLLGVDILNAQVFVEQMSRMGFQLERLIDRRIPTKILPQVRDKKTGRFTSTTSADFLAYPHEYILVMKKR